MRKRQTKTDRKEERPVSLDDRVQAYVAKWEMQVKADLHYTQVNLLRTQNEPERSRLKTNFETQSAVLDLLQGRQKQKTPAMTELTVEISSLKSKLNQAKKKLTEANQCLQTNEKIIRQLKSELNDCVKQVLKAKETETRNQMLCQLKEFEVTSVSKLAVEYVVNMNPRNKVQEAQKQLEHKSSEDVYEDCVDFCVTYEGNQLEEYSTTRQQSSDTDRPLLELVPEEAPGEQQDEEFFEMDSVDYEDHFNEGLSEEEQVICLKVSDLEKIVDSAVSQLWEEKEATLESQRVDIAKYQTAVRRTEEQLQTQQEESRKVLEAKQKEWAQRFEELERSFKDQKERRPRNRNWFVRMFSCSSGRNVDQ